MDGHYQRPNKNEKKYPEKADIRFSIFTTILYDFSKV